MFNLENFIIDGTTFGAPPTMYHYNEKRGDDYNPVDGEVIKWDNGLMVITGTYDLGECGTSSLRKWGSFYETNSQHMPHFQEEFVDNPYVVYSVIDNNAAFTETIREMSTTKMGEVYFFVPKSTSPFIQINFIAIGRWK